MPGGRFVFKGQKRKKDEEPREFAAGRSITLSGDPTAAGAYVPFAKGLMDRLEAQFLEHGNTRHHTIAVHNGTIRFEVSEGRRAIHIEAGGPPIGEWICLPTAEGNRGGFGPPFVGQDIATPEFGEPVNEPMGVGSSELGYTGPSHVKFGRKDREDDGAGWEVTARAQDQKHAMTDWKMPGLPIVTWQTIATGRYFPHRDNYFPGPNSTYVHDSNYWYTGTKVWAGETLLLNTEQVVNMPYPIYGILGAAIRVESAPKFEYRATSDQPGFPNFMWVQTEPPEQVLAVYLLVVVTDGYPIRRTWETWNTRVGEKDPESGEIKFYSPVESNFQAAPKENSDPLQDGINSLGVANASGSGDHPRLIRRSAQYGYKPGGRLEGSDQENLETLAKYGQPFYFAQPATKCSTFTIGRIFTVDWVYDGSTHFNTTLDIGEPEYDSGKTEGSGTFSDGPSLSNWYVGEKYLADYGLACPTDPENAKSAMQSFIDAVLSDNKTWRFKETISGTTGGGTPQPFVRHVWEGVDNYLLEPPRNFTFEEITGKANTGVTAFYGTATGRRYSGFESDSFSNGTLAVDYEGQSLRKWTSSSSSKRITGGYVTNPQFSGDPYNCICSIKTTFADANQYQSEMTLEGVRTFNWSSSRQSPGSISGCGQPSSPGGSPGEENLQVLTFLYADMRGAGELFWWESGPVPSGGINFAQIWRFPGVLHTLKSHIDGTIYSGSS